MSRSWSPEKRPTERHSLYDTTCPASGGKRSYPSRVQARKARNRIDRHLNIYRCDACSGYHLGHLPRAVVAGTVSRAEMFG